MAPHIDAFAPSRTKQSHESTEASKPGTQETTCPKGYSRFLQQELLFALALRVSVKVFPDLAFAGIGWFLIYWALTHIDIWLAGAKSQQKISLHLACYLIAGFKRATENQ